MPKPRVTKAKKPASKYVKDNSAFLSTKASERKRIKAPGATDGTGVNWKEWWLADENDIGLATETVIIKIETEQSIRFTSFINWARLYGNWEAMSWGANVLNNTNQDLNNEQPLRLNLIQAGIDSCAAKIAKDNPQPYFITSGGDYFEKLRAERLTKYVRGVMQQQTVYNKAIKQFRDGEVYGLGALHFYCRDDQVKCDWVPTFELRVADNDGMTQEPRSMHRVRMISREQLIAMFPDQREMIAKLSTNAANRIRDNQQIVDMIRLKESWHLRSSKNAEDGVYAVTVNDKCLLRETYDLDFFPIVVFRWMDKALGFYGRSVTEEVYSVQMSLDELLNVASQSYAMVGMPIIFVPDGAQIPEDVILSNFIARLVPYRGATPPQFATPEPLPSSFIQWVQLHIGWVFQIIGISQATSTSQNQLGPNASGAAIREMVDIETGRFAQVSTRWEDNFVNCANVIVALSKKLYEKKKDLKVQYTYKKAVYDIPWKDVNINGDFVTRCEKTSQLPDTVAGRIQTVSEWIDRQWVSKERGMELMQLDPDVEQEVNLRTSSMRICEKRLADMVETGTYYKPEPFMNLAQALDISLGVYNMLLVDGCPEDRLQLVRQWIADINSLTPVQPSGPAAPLAPTASPAGAPEPQMPGAAPPAAPPPQAA